MIGYVGNTAKSGCNSWIESQYIKSPADCSHYIIHRENEARHSCTQCCLRTAKRLAGAMRLP
jgi:hypothetical protein